jgi:ferrous iron transport protein B
LLDLGFVPGARVSAVLRRPDGGLVSYRVKGADIALRRDDAAQVRIATGIRHQREGGRPAGPPERPQGRLAAGGVASRPAREVPVVALAGNPNTGKSTVFNALTGLRQHVGNWPGKTVARLEGIWNRQGQTFRVMDLPGTYSLLSDSPEEEIARDYILAAEPDCVVVVADATCLERNLNLAFQIMEITPHVVLCVNLIDQAKARGIRINQEHLQELLGVPVVMTCARNAEDIARLGDWIDRVASRQTVPQPARVRYGERLEQALGDIASDVERLLPGVSSRWMALRLVDGTDAGVRQWVTVGEPSGLCVMAERAERRSCAACRA